MAQSTPKSTSKSPQEVFNDFLHTQGLRSTSQRQLIFEVLLDSEGHLSSEELCALVKERDDSVGQATVYRTLKLLAEAGLAKVLRFGDGVTRYEPTYGQEHHDHLICERCRKTLEIVDEQIEVLQEELARRHGFTLTGHRMYLYGVCTKCRKNS